VPVAPGRLIRGRFRRFAATALGDSLRQDRQWAHPGAADRRARREQAGRGGRV